MELDEALEITISKKTAIKEIKKHGCDVNEFFEEVGEKSEYVGLQGWFGRSARHLIQEGYINE
tara:strand:- start:1554 stop:1742 length:189 start_codon:yes stop_codon:yes gene_type:complete